MQDDEEVIKLWKECDIKKCELTFDCGGDSMGNMDFQYYNSKDKEVNNKKTQELTSFFEEDVMDKVEFYVNSDGHYIGESGTVYITLEDDEFSYEKVATSEFNETLTEEMEVELSDKEVKFLKDNIDTISCEDDTQDQDIRYKRDLIITEKDEELIQNLCDRIDGEANDYTFDTNGEWNDFMAWTTWEESTGNDMIITKVKNKTYLKVFVTKTFYVYEESN
jgi:hypothetical protein